MAKVVRIDDFVKNPDGTVDVHITVGSPPLPLAPQGLVLNFTDLGQLGFRMAEAEQGLTDMEMAMILLSNRVDATNDVTFSNPLNFKGKSFQLDISATIGTISFF